MMIKLILASDPLVPWLATSARERVTLPRNMSTTRKRLAKGMPRGASSGWTKWKRGTSRTPLIKTSEMVSHPCFTWIRVSLRSGTKYDGKHKLLSLSCNRSGIRVSFTFNTRPDVTITGSKQLDEVNRNHGISLESAKITATSANGDWMDLLEKFCTTWTFKAEKEMKGSKIVLYVTKALRAQNLLRIDAFNMLGMDYQNEEICSL